MLSLVGVFRRGFIRKNKAAFGAVVDPVSEINCFTFWTGYDHI